jgi:hypothetical protein
MSVLNVQEIITRAVQDAEFRGLLLRDPGQALAGYDLSEVERAELSALRPEQFDSPGADLEARLSHSIVWGDGPQPGSSSIGGVVWGG